MVKPRILVFSNFYLPGFRAGGPIRTISNLVEHLGGDFTFRIVTLDRDLGDEEAYPSIIPGVWNRVGNAEVFYLEREKITLRRLVSLIAEVEPDCIYLNSFFDPLFTQRLLLLMRCTRIARLPVVIAPRGELSRGALALKPIRKRLYLWASRLLGLHRGLIFQVSSGQEHFDVCKALPFASVKIARNLTPSIPEAISQKVVEAKSTGLRLCFLSRISPMKNLDFALRCLKAVAEDVHFTIYGPIEDELYWERCRRIIETLPANVNVIYGGAVEHDLVHATLAKHDLFFLPSRGENYGHVILEALSAGLAVLVSDQTPWNDLDEANVGWSLSLQSRAQFATNIDWFARLNRSERELTRQRAITYARGKCGDIDAVASNRDLFTRALGGTGS